jgi:AcrR family transcriptional regulator
MTGRRSRSRDEKGTTVLANRQWEEEIGVELARHELAPTAERIIKAARRILVRKGYPSLTMQEIEKESGVNRALVHYYFGSKAGLVEALVETLFEDPAFGYSDEVVRAPEGEQRRKALLAWLRRIVRDRRSGRLLYELLPHFLRSRRLRAHVAGLYGAYRDFDGRCLASGVSGVDQGDRESIGALSVAVVEGLGIQLAVDPRGFDEGGAYGLWEEMVAAYLAAKERTAQGFAARNRTANEPATNTGAAVGRDGAAAVNGRGAKRRQGGRKA